MCRTSRSNGCRTCPNRRRRWILAKHACCTTGFASKKSFALLYGLTAAAATRTPCKPKLAARVVHCPFCVVEARERVDERVCRIDRGDEPAAIASIFSHVSTFYQIVRYHPAWPASALRHLVPSPIPGQDRISRTGQARPGQAMPESRRLTYRGSLRTKLLRPCSHCCCSHCSHWLPCAAAPSLAPVHR
jgi:hypothetical protein